MEEENKYKVYEQYGNDYYTTNKYLNDSIKRTKRRLTLVGNFVGGGVLSLFITLIVAACLSEISSNLGFIIALSFSGVSLIELIICGIIAGINDSWYADLINIYQNSEEFINQVQAYKLIEKENEQKRKEEKARKLVEMYDILDDNNASQDDRVEWLKNYIDLK